MNIAVYGSSQPQPGSRAYQEAYELGRLLGSAGHTVLTGGYIGTMEAVSRGAAEAGTRVIGVTCEEIEKWRPVKPNAWVQEEHRFASLNERLEELVRGCDGAIALPGGPGTLTEVALAWNLMIITAMRPKPLILVGPGWKSVFQAMFEALSDTTPENQRRLLRFVPDVEAAVSSL
jgi:uncharacterized protein (TIGR00730 family)